MLLYILRGTGQPHITKNYPGQNVTSVETEEPRSTSSSAHSKVSSRQEDSIAAQATPKTQLEATHKLFATLSGPLPSATTGHIQDPLGKITGFTGTTGTYPQVASPETTGGQLGLATAPAWKLDLEYLKGNLPSRNLPLTAGMSISTSLPIDLHHNPWGLQSRNKHPQITEEGLEAQRNQTGCPLNSLTC